MSVYLDKLSVSRRLSLLAFCAASVGGCMIALVLTSSLLSARMDERAQDAADQALFAALLEKDFASLERDVFRHALINNAATREAYEGNTRDFFASNEETRQHLRPDEMSAADVVEDSAKAYVATVEAVLREGVVADAGVARIMEAGDKVDSNIEAIRDPVIARSQAIDAEQTSLAFTMVAVSVVLALLTCGFAYVLAQRVRRSIVNELSDIRSAISRVEDGEVEFVVPHLHRTDEIGDLARVAERLQTMTRAKAESDARTHAMIEMVGTQLSALAEGDLTAELPDIGATYSRLRADFNTMAGRLRDALLAVSHAIHAIHTGAREINDASSDFATRTEQHASDLGEAAERIRDLSSDISSTASEATTAHRSVVTAVEEARSGGSIVSEAVAAMQSIDHSTAEIKKIISVIDGIAFQTNLLALNAGVEAARAGEMGKGFAVVANEVRALAQRSADAAREVRELIETSSSQVASGVVMVNDTGSALDRIIESIASATQLVTSIADSSQVQSEKLRQTTETISAMDRVTQQNAAMIEESTAAARSLSSEADRLSELVGKFKLGSGEIVPLQPRPVAPSRIARASFAPSPQTFSVVGSAALQPAGSDGGWDDF